MGKIIQHKNNPLLILLLLYVIPNIGNAQKFAFVSKPVKRVALGVTYQYTFAAVDSNGKAITYDCRKLPSWIRFDKKNNILSGIAKKTGQYAIQINAATSDTLLKQNFMLTVHNKQTLNILPLGNSITNGTGVYNSYRRSLWQLLHKANYNFDFIGSWDLHHMGGVVPNPDFDMDHEGHSGWTAQHVLQPPDWDTVRGSMDEWLLLYRPDIVLIELGTNEVFQCTSAISAMNNLSVIIDKLRLTNSSVIILLAQIPPLGNQWAPKKLCGTDTAYKRSLQLFNEAVVRFTHLKTTAKSPVIIVDQFSGVNPATDMYDDIHPNKEGEIKMAQRWFKALKPFLTKLN